MLYSPPVRATAPRIDWVTDSPRGKAATGRTQDAVRRITGESPRTAGKRGPGTQSSLAAESWGDRCLLSITIRSCLSAAVGSGALKRAQVGTPAAYGEAGRSPHMARMTWHTKNIRTPRTAAQIVNAKWQYWAYHGFRETKIKPQKLVWTSSQGKGQSSEPLDEI
ncbi:hypothetical protein K438DRAFT_1747419 [Mycena galopus ATCC 62051]|nr:hypothetical protein K438DRAFT_1747419 [Mycena galopus ATCC 62051]